MVARSTTASKWRSSVRVEFPEKLQCLFTPKRYKFLRGGRGSGKSWGIARALLIQGAAAPHRILCTREVQKSIKQSVHQLLKDQVEALGLSSFYEVLSTEIRGKNGTTFHFAGLSDLTVDSIKSFEGCTRVWIEEGQTITPRSWKILTPTIREDGSEIWTSYNPELDTDETHRRAMVDDPDTLSVEVNFSDNPWFPPELEKERVKDEQRLPPEEYAHIWLGRCLPAVQGAIYFNEVAKAEARIRDVPYDPLLKVHAVWDLGWNDSMSIILAQRSSSEVRIIDYIEDSHRVLSDYVQDLKARPLNWGNDYLPHDGFTKDFKTGKSAEEILKAMGRKVKPTPNLHIENGIKAAREVFPRCYFAKDKTQRLVECLKRYRRQIGVQTQEAGAPLHDQYSHGADAFRYLAIVADQMSNEDWGGTGKIKYPSLGIA